MLAGCGAGDEPEAVGPALDPAVAEPLAAKSEEIAAALDAGDVCGAAVRADELLAQVVAAINAGSVPPAFQEELTARANELVETVNCPPPPPTETEDDEEDDDDQRGRGREDDDDDDDEDGGEEPPPLLPPPTETEAEPQP